MMKLSGKAVLLAAGAAAFTSGEARAALITLPSPTQQAVAETLDNTGNPVLVQIGTGSAEVSDGSGNAAFAGTDLTTQSASAQTSGSANTSAFANYSFEILGPAASPSVPVFIVGSVHASIAQSGAGSPEIFNMLGAFSTLVVGSKAVRGGDIFGAGASVSHTGPGGPLVADCGDGASPSRPDPSCVINRSGSVGPFLLSATFSFEQELLMPANAEIDVFVSAGAGPTQNGVIPPDASIQAVTDPFFQIDPIFLSDNPGYSLVFPPGVENNPPGTGTPAAVPEPASLALFGAGFLVFGTLRRRRTACITR